MRYHDGGAISGALALCAQRTAERCSLREIGTSAEGRPVTALTLAPVGAEPQAERPQALVTANIHGAEAIGAEVALGIIDLLSDPQPAGPAAELLSLADVTVVPVLNPDGREAAFASLSGRPGRVPPRRNARGVDLNRNFPFPPDARDVWHPLSGTGISWLPWYRGPSTLSEPETSALGRLAADLAPLAAVNLHSAGRLFLHPYCYTAEAPADIEGFRAMGEAFRAAQAHWRYEVRQSRAWYAILGDLDDWLYDTFDTMSVTVEIGRVGEAVRRDPRRALRGFWWANPSDPRPYVENDAAACCAALVEGCRHRGAA